MPKSDKQTRVNWVRIIEAVASPLGLYVLVLLIIGSFLDFSLPAYRLPQEDMLFLIKAGIGVIVLVVCAVTVLTWSRPAHLIFDKASILIDRGNMPVQEEFRASTAADATGKIVRKFWKPDSKTTNKRNEARLEKWMKANGLSNVSITAFISAEYFTQLRIKAIRDLGIASGEEL